MSPNDTPTRTAEEKIMNASRSGLSPREPTGEKTHFLLAAASKTLSRCSEIDFDQTLARHRSGRVRSKNFEKSEKKACQPAQTPLILTAKPNQTIGETNDKKRT